MIKAILLDLDNTLYNYSPCNNHANQEIWKETANIFNLPFEQVEQAFKEARLSFKKSLHGTASSHSRLLYIQKMIELLAQKADAALVLRLHGLFWDAYIQKMIISDEIKETLRKFKEKGIRIIIVTDLTLDIQMRKMVHTQINTLVDSIVSSEEAGVEKPNQRIFELALEKAGCKAEECIFVGDDYEKDIQGALAMHIRAIHSTNPNDFPQLLLDFLHKEKEIA